MFSNHWFRSIFFALLIAGALPFDNAQAARSGEEELIILGVEIQQALVSVCATQEQAESVVKTYGESGSAAAIQAFNQNQCFITVLSFVPNHLVFSKRLTKRRAISVVEVLVWVAQSPYTLYIITENPVVTDSLHTQTL